MKLNIRYTIAIFIILLLSMIWIFITNNPTEVTQEKSMVKNIIVLNADAMKMAGIQVSTLKPRILTYFINAPGEVIPNANLTTKIAARISSLVIRRYVQEGEHVKSGQPLVDLSSVDMAKTQSELILAALEWERVKSLGKDAISAKRYSEAQVGFQHAYSMALAYGMTEPEINNLLQTKKPSQANGEYKLLAPHDGTVFNLNLTDGELVEIGKVLLQIVQEKIVWVDAKLAPDLVRPIDIGDNVRVEVSGKILSGKVIQIHHQLDETTRTRLVRIEIPNPDDLLHPGQFLNCQIESGHTQAVLALPIDAVLRTADGDWAVYVEKKPGHFQQVEVKIIEVIDNQAIIQGVASGTRVATKGAFFIHSELNKSGFGTDE